MDYPLEQLDPERFQKVCQALLLPEFPSARFFPVGQADGGRDAFVTLHPRARSSKQLVVFQVKFARDPSEFRNLAARRQWVLDAVKEELPKIEALAQNGARHYRLITNVRGSGRRTTGSIDKLDELLAGLPIHADGWWRDDLTSRLDQAWDVKWRYPELLTGPDLLRALVEGGLNEHAARRSSAVRAFLEEERHGDEKVKFKQVGLENSLLDLFVDLPLSSSGATVKDRRVAGALAAVAMETDDESTSHPSGMSFVDFEEGRWWGRTQSAPAASFLLHDTATDVAPWVVIEGAPGQGKSTVSQYLCQVHRYRLLNDTQAISRLSANHCRGGSGYLFVSTCAILPLGCTDVIPLGRMSRKPRQGVVPSRPSLRHRSRFRLGGPILRSPISTLSVAPAACYSRLMASMRWRTSGSARRW